MTIKDSGKKFDEATQTIKGYFQKRREVENDLLNMFKEALESKPKSDFTNIVLALVNGVSNRHIEMLTLMEGLTENLLFLANETRERIGNLELAIREISDKSGIELSGIKKQVEELKGTVQSPMIEQVAKFIQRIEDEAKKRENAKGEYVD